MGVYTQCLHSAYTVHTPPHTLNTLCCDSHCDLLFAVQSTSENNHNWELSGMEVRVIH